MAVVSPSAAYGLSDGSGAVALATASGLGPVTDRIAAVMQSPASAAASGETEDEEGEVGGIDSNKHANSDPGPLGTVDKGVKSNVPSAGVSFAQVPRLVQPYVRLSGEDDTLLRDLANMQEKILQTLRAAGMLRDSADRATDGGEAGNNGRDHSSLARVCDTAAAPSQPLFTFLPYEKPPSFLDSASGHVRASQGESGDNAMEAGTAAVQKPPYSKQAKPQSQTTSGTTTMIRITTTNTIKQLASDVEKQRENLKMSHEINAQKPATHTTHLISTH